MARGRPNRESAIGGENIATTIEGRERYPINVRYLQPEPDTELEDLVLDRG